MIAQMMLLFVRAVPPPIGVAESEKVCNSVGNTYTQYG